MESQEIIWSCGVVGGGFGVIVSYYSLGVLSEALSDSGMAHEVNSQVQARPNCGDECETAG